MLDRTTQIELVTAATLHSELVRNRVLSQTLVAVSRAIQALSDPRSICHVALDHAVRVAGATGGSVLLREVDGALATVAHRAMLTDLRGVDRVSVVRRLAALAVDEHRTV